MALLNDIIKKYEAEAQRRINEARAKKGGQGSLDGAVVNQGTTQSYAGLRKRGSSNVFATESNVELLSKQAEPVVLEERSAAEKESEFADITALGAEIAPVAGATPDTLDVASELAALKAEVKQLKERLAALDGSDH
ncbi:hypothetical protein HYS54_04840 [Candidatus Micrarchaeota archaeon]|nr:hypothetical protein [Candidatus Micrarchaeota archaeon]